MLNGISDTIREGFAEFSKELNVQMAMSRWNGECYRIVRRTSLTVGQKIAARNCEIPVLQLVVYGYCTKLSRTLIVCTSLERAFIRRLSDMDNGYWRNLI